MPDRSLGGAVTKFAAGNLGGWKGAQPARRSITTPPTPAAASSQPVWVEGFGPQTTLITYIGDIAYATYHTQNAPYEIWKFEGIGSGLWTFVADFPAALTTEMAATTYAQNVAVTTDGSDTLYISVLEAHNSTPAFRLSRFWKYQISINTWTQLTDPPGATGNQSNSYLGFANGNVYMIGGVQSNNTFNVLNTVSKYTVSSNTWSAVTSAPEDIRALGTTCLPIAIGGDDLMVFSGGDVNTYGAWRYSASDDTWTTLSLMSSSGVLGYFCIGTLNDGRFVLMGAANPVVYFYTAGSDSYEAYDFPIEDQVQIFSGAVINNTAYFMDLGNPPGWYNPLGF